MHQKLSYVYLCQKGAPFQCIFKMDGNIATTDLHKSKHADLLAVIRASVRWVRWLARDMGYHYG